MDNKWDKRIKIIKKPEKIYKQILSVTFSAFYGPEAYKGLSFTPVKSGFDGNTN